MEKQISNFEKIEQFENYNKNTNHLHLSVYDLLPIGVKWNYNGKKYIIKNGNKIEALLLNNNVSIAIIEEPYNIIKNKAYIINGNNEIEYDLKELLRENKNLITEYDIKDFFIYEIHYIDSELYCFINIDEFDYRFSLNVLNGKIGKLIFMR